MVGSTVAKSTRFLALDGMRAISAYIVMIHHFGPDIPLLQHPAILGLIGQFSLGVTPFFVLSGFVITYHYFDLPITGFMPYLMRRIGRIVPLYMLLTTLTYLVFARQGMHLGESGLTYYLIDIALLKGWFNDLKFSGILQGWSITTEMAFYVLAPFIFVVIRRWGWRAVALLLILFVVTGLLLVGLLGGSTPYGFMVSNAFMFGCTVFGRAPDFFAGIGLALVFKQYGSRVRIRYATVFGSMIIAACLIIRAYLKGDYTDMGGVLISNFVLPVFGIGLLFWGLLTEETLLRKILSTNLLQVLGRSSYAFYLIHLGVFYWAIHDMLGSFPATIIALQVLAWVLYRTIEVPCVRWVKQRWPFPNNSVVTDR